MAGKNRIVFSGTLTELDALRHTPAAVPIVKFRLAHDSEQNEAGMVRKVSCEIAAVAFEREARLLSSARLGSMITVTGFIERKGRSKTQVVLHATHIEFEQE